MGEKSGTHALRREVCAVQSVEATPLSSVRHSWEFHTEMDVDNVSCELVDWILVLQDRDRWLATVNTAMNRSNP
jgi:hypothetical protein